MTFLVPPNAIVVAAAIVEVIVFCHVFKPENSLKTVSIREQKTQIDRAHTLIINPNNNQNRQTFEHTNNRTDNVYNL